MRPIYGINNQRPRAPPAEAALLKSLMTYSATLVQDAAIGEIAFTQHDTEAFGFTVGRWIARSRRLYLKDKRTKNTDWHAELSEIHCLNVDKPMARRTRNQFGDLESADYAAIAVECMDTAFEQLTDEAEVAL